MQISTSIPNFSHRGELTARIYAAPLITQAWTIRPSSASVTLLESLSSHWRRESLCRRLARLRHRLLFRTVLTISAESRPALRRNAPHLAHARTIMKADAAGLQICTHAIGDRRNFDHPRSLLPKSPKHTAKPIAASASSTPSTWPPRTSNRFAQLHVIASVQPYHAIDDGRWAEQRIGHDRASRTYAFRTFLDHGVRLAFGTDWDVAPLNPLLGVYAAVTRATLDGKNPNGWFPEQKLSVGEAVEAYTMGSAYAEFQENEKGSITPGKLADMVLLSEDIFSLDPPNIRDVKVLKTFVGGKLVWDGNAAVGDERSNR